VTRSASGSLLDELDRYVGQAQTDGHRDPVVAVEEPDVVGEPEAQRHPDPVLPDAFGQLVEVDRRVDDFEGRDDLLAVHRPIAHDQLGGQPDHPASRRRGHPGHVRRTRTWRGGVDAGRTG
jgi:hypothetical protein